MAMPTILSIPDPRTLSAKTLWEDPCITLERILEVKAQGGPPGEGGPNLGDNRGFLGPLNVSASSSTTGFC